MAYVTINWEYGDDSVIEGFRLYRDGLLRGTVEPTAREFNDNVDDTSERMVKYEVKAYDNANRESYGCAYVDVRLMSITTQDMTSQNTPANNVYGWFTGGISGVDEAWEAFDRASNRVEFRIDSTGMISIYSKYIFSEDVQRLSTWGYMQNLQDHGQLLFATQGTVKIYGTNVDDASTLGDLLDTIVLNRDLVNGTEILKDLIDPVYYKAYTVVFNFYSNYDLSNQYLDHGIYDEILLYDRPEVT